MILGLVIKPVMLVAGGTAVTVLLLLQILVGMRKIRFKGRLHMQVHKWGAWAVFAMALVHGILGLVYAQGIVVP